MMLGPERLVNRKKAADMGDHQINRGLFSLGTEFNDFLYERIGAGPWDTQVSVVSALARMDLDPWAEAKRLSQLPDESATLSVSSMLSRLPEAGMAIGGHQQTARRLVQLLPKKFAGNQPDAAPAREPRSRTLPWLILAGIICVFPLMVAVQFFRPGHSSAAAEPRNRVTALSIPTAPSPAGK